MSPFLQWLLRKQFSHNWCLFLIVTEHSCKTFVIAGSSCAENPHTLLIVGIVVVVVVVVVVIVVVVE